MNYHLPQPGGHAIQPRWSDLGATQRAEGDDPAMVEGDHSIEKEVCVTSRQVLVQMHVTNWAAAQREDPILDAASSEEGKMVWRNCQNFMVLHDALYLHSMPKGENEDLLLFIVLKAHWTAVLNGCHQDAGHQGHDSTLSLLQECFWWPEWPNR